VGARPEPPTGPVALHHIGLGAFIGAGFASVTLPATLQHLGRMAFGRCPNLARVDLRCPALRELELDAFGFCPRVTHAALPSQFEHFDPPPAGAGRLWLAWDGPPRGRRTGRGLARLTARPSVGPRVHTGESQATVYLGFDQSGKVTRTRLPPAGAGVARRCRCPPSPRRTLGGAHPRHAHCMPGLRRQQWLHRSGAGAAPRLRRRVDR